MVSWWREASPGLLVEVVSGSPGGGKWSPGGGRWSLGLLVEVGPLVEGGIPWSPGGGVKCVRGSYEDSAP